MFTLRRKAVQSAKPLWVSRRHYSTPHDDGHGADHGHHEHHTPQPESFGTGFYVALAIVPLSIGTYVVSRPSAEGPSAISKLITKYSDYKAQWADRSHLHTAMIEQAAYDRNLFQSSPGSAHIELRFPEIFNTGSPYNIVAGQGPRNMDKLVEHYKKQNEDEITRRENSTAAEAARMTSK